MIKLVINKQFIKLIYYKDYYKSWTINYSNGQTLNQDGKFISLWEMPTFHYVTTKQLVGK